MDKTKQKQINQIYYQANHNVLFKPIHDNKNQLSSQELDTDIDYKQFIYRIFKSESNGIKIYNAETLNYIRPLINLDLVSINKDFNNPTVIYAYLTKLGKLLAKYLYKDPQSKKDLKRQANHYSSLSDFGFVMAIAGFANMFLFCFLNSVVFFILSFIVALTSCCFATILDDKSMSLNDKEDNHGHQVTANVCLPFLKKHVSNHDFIKDKEVFINEVTK